LLKTVVEQQTKALDCADMLADVTARYATAA